ncbi:MAG: SpoIIE family protein phosphatase [Actinomycetia bacterium]|nr:SpoIIE family protein phosphatase [Actinomycetes bacterium]
MTDGQACVPVSGEDPLPGDLAAAVALGGENGRWFAEFDWAAHPLGPPAQWPTEVCAAMAIALASRFPIGLFLSSTDQFLIYNDACIPMLADKHPAALGQPGREVFWEIWDDSIGPMISGVLDTGNAAGSDELMLPLVTAGRAQERYFTLTYNPIFGGDGEVLGVFIVVLETTGQILGERRLSLLNAVASALMEARSVDDAVNAVIAASANQPSDVPFIALYVTDPETGDPTLRGATPSMMSILPRRLSDLTDGRSTAPSSAAVAIIDAVAAVIPGIEQALGGDCPDQALVLAVGEGSTAGAIVVGMSPWRPLDEQYRSFCRLLADQLSSVLASTFYSEEQRARADTLAELDRAKTALLTNVSHEFRTPLTLLLGPLDDAIAVAESNTVLAESLTTVRRNAGRLKRMVDTLLDFSRIEAGRATARLVCTDVGALTAAIALSFGELCDRAGLELVVDCDPVLADIDVDMWETILLNLLSNAVKYTLHGSITVEVRDESGQCRVAVRDTGVGIAEADQDRLFERFFRADNVGARSVEGTGIGLALVRGLVELEQGTVGVDSEPDRGTTVTILLPRSPDGVPIEHPPGGDVDPDNPYIAEAAQWLDPVTVGPAADAADERRDLVLVAEDNADMRTHLDRVLSARWDTVLVADGASALALARDRHPDAIVTDVMMPVLNGFELVAAIRADPALAAIPILMLSARAGAEEISEGFAGGADDYLAKPFRSQELLDRVEARLSTARRDRQRSAALTRFGAGLAQLDAALQASESVTAILDALLNSRTACGDASAVAISVLDAQGGVVRAEHAGALPTELRDRYHVAPLDAPLLPVDVIKTGEPMIITDTLGLPPRYHHAARDAASSCRACVVQPLHDGTGGVVGALTLMWPTRRHFDPDEIEMFARTAEITQWALDRVRVMVRERQIALDFQKHLLDLERKSTAAVVAAVSEPAGETMRVGGDWYLVAALDSPGQIAISVGDVVGHGLPAAVVMSRLRAVVAGIGLTGADPAEVLTILDKYATSVPGARGATAAYAVIDTAADGDAATGADGGTATVSYSCAGHPYPLLVSPGCPPVFLKSGRRPPVAAKVIGPESKAAAADLPPGSVLIFYTDGLIERRGESLDQGFARLLLAAAGCADLPAGDICEKLVDWMAPPGGYTDDVVVLAVRPSHVTARSFATVLPAAISSLYETRHQFDRWVSTVVADPRRAHDIVLATGEAITNAIEHGSPHDSSTTVAVEACTLGEAITVTVSDSGCWSGDSTASRRQGVRGRGLTLVHGLADSVDTVRTASGTRMSLRFDHAVGSVSCSVNADVG